MKEKGSLYIVATPIGNLGDITHRAIDILKSVNVIASEDTRKTRKLLTHFDIRTRLFSYHEHNTAKKLDDLLTIVKSGDDIALVSEAGTPVVSDPGYRLIKRSAEENIDIIPIPGASAAITALSVSGLPSDRFLFMGFLPDKKGKRRKKLEEIKYEGATLILYISKWKIHKMLQDMIDILGDRRICFCRELTKIHEEILHTSLSELLRNIEDRKLKGEITLVVEGAD